MLLAARTAGDWPETDDALGAGPLLLQNGEIVDHGDAQRSIRHPRSAIARTNSGSVLLITVDGRTAESVGVSFEELAKLLRAVGALNLDGGGSSTLWVAGR